MKIKNAWFFLTAIGAVLIIIFLQQELPGSATPDHVIEPQVTAGIENITLDPTTHKPVSIATIQPPPLDETQQIAATSLIENLKKTAIAANPMGQPGWYLTVVKVTYDIDTPNNGVLPNGVEIPKEYTLELWMYFDDHEKLTQLVTLGKTLTGDVFQAGVEKDGRGWNSAMGDAEKSSDLFYGDFLTGPHKQALDVAKLSPATVINELINDQKITTISTQENYRDPVKIDELNMEVIQTISRFSFNQENGLIVKTETIAVFVDGSERAINIEEYFYLGNIAEPSGEALTYLEKVGGR